MRFDTRPTEPIEDSRRLPKAEKIEKEEEEEEEEEDAVTVGQHSQGRTVAQSGQRVPKRSLRQVGQIPVLRRLEGCFGHFHTSSSSA